MSKKKWIKDMYNVTTAGLIRRGVFSLPKGISPSEVMDDARARGHKPIIVGDQIVIIL